MARLIDADDVTQKLRKEIEDIEPIDCWDDALSIYKKRTVPRLITDVIFYIEKQPTVDAVCVKVLEKILSTEQGLGLWDYQKIGIISAVNRLCGKEKNDG